MTKFADLHIHTIFSDSTLTPEEVVQGALSSRLSCIAITDHDTLEGVKPTELAAKDSGLEVISAIELSSELSGKDIHILGYFIDGRNSAIQEALYKMRETRIERIKKMIEKLKTLGIDNILLEEVMSLTSQSVGRPHLAAVLKNKGWVSSISQAFEKYIGEDGPAYVGKYKITPHEAITLIKESGGIAVMAHPMVTNRDELIPGLVEAGLQGIEVFYPNYPESTLDYYKGLAQKNNLVMTGGSDAHGKAKTNTFIGKMRISYELVEQLKEIVQK